MIRLATLGEIDLRRTDGLPVSSVLQQPRRLALLGYLAVADTTLVPRDTLIGLFWPEKREERARHDVSQAIHYLRRALGGEVIQGGGTDGYGVAPGSLSCDARDFSASLKRGDREEALRLYRGDFLPGFYVSGAPDFEQWLEAFRGQLRRQAAETAWQLAEADAEANPVSAARAARQAVEFSLGDEAAVRRLLELLHRIGDQAGAFEAFESFRRRLAAEHGVGPSEETVELMTRLRATSPATEPIPIAPPENAAGVPAAPPPAASRAGLLRRHPLQAAASAAVTFALVVSFVSLWGLTRGRADASVGPSVVVEDVRDYSRASARDDLAGALTTEVLARLARVRGVRARPAAENAAEAGYEPHHLVLRTGMLHSADSVRITAVLLDGHSRITIDRAFAVRPVVESMALVDDIARWLSGFARKSAGGWLREQEWRDRHPRGRALSLMRRAVRDRERADSLRRVGLFPAALASYEKADSHLAAAEKVSPDWSAPTIQRAETSLALMWLHLLSTPPQLERSRASLDTGLDHAARAVRGGDPAALEIRAVLRYWRWRTAPPDSYPAAAALLPGIEADLARTLELDPTRARAWETLSGLLQSRGDFGAARWAAEHAYEADAFLEHLPGNLASLFSTTLETSDSGSARRWCDELRKRHAGDSVTAFCELMLLATFGSAGSADVRRGWAAIRALGPQAQSPPWNGRHELLMSVLLARAGAIDSAKALLRRASRASASADPEAAQFIAWSLLELGERDSAAAVLEQYVSVRRDARVGVLHSERFRELRQHPRLAELMR